MSFSMIDGTIDNLFLLIAFALGCAFAAPVAAEALLRPRAGSLRFAAGLERAGAGVLLLVWCVLLPLNVYAHLSGRPLDLVFGSETFDGGVVENLTFAGLLVVAWLAGRVALERTEPPVVRLLSGLITVALVFVALEEVSYGQHWIGWSASGVFAESNLQAETNLHNFVDPRLYDLVYATIGSLAVLGGLLVRLGLVRGLLMRLGVVGEAVSGGRYGVALSMTAGTLLIHEVFEELSEFAAVAAFAYIALAAFELWRARLPRSEHAEVLPEGEARGA